MSRKALIIVDMQYGFMNKNTEHLRLKLKNFLRSNRNKFDLVIGTRYINNYNTPCYKFEGWDKCMEGTEESELIPLVSEYIDYDIGKGVYSCWSGVKESIGKSHKRIDKVYFVGVNTGCCVLHSVFDAYNDLQDCAVISDLCASTSGIESHKAALQILKECITPQRVITTEQFEKEV